MFVCKHCRLAFGHYSWCPAPEHVNLIRYPKPNRLGLPK